MEGVEAVTNPPVYQDLQQPQPVRVAAFAGALAQAVLIVLSLTLDWDGALVAALTGVIGVAQLGGWLFVRTVVTPIASPQDEAGRALMPVEPDAAPGSSAPA